MKTFWIYGYAGEIVKQLGRSARDAAAKAAFAVAVVRDNRGAALTPDLWA